MLKPEQIQERFDLIGGSDLYDLFNLGNYGCARKLWYEKKNKYIPEMTPAMERGFLLEDIVRRKFSEEHGDEYDVIEVDDKTFIKDEHIGGHIDGLLTDKKTGKQGVLEIKIPNLYSFKIYQKEGVPEHYTLQVQYYMWLTNSDFAVLVVFNADKWDYFTIKYNRDDELIEDIKEVVYDFINNYIIGADEPAGVYDARCNKCPFNHECASGLKFEKEKTEEEKKQEELLGEKLTELEKLLIEYSEVKSALVVLQEKEKELKTKIDEITPVDSKIVLPQGQVVKSLTHRVSLDTKKIEKELPDVYEKYKKEKEYTTLRIYLRE